MENEDRSWLLLRWVIWASYAIAYLFAFRYFCRELNWQKNGWQKNEISTYA